MTKNKTRFAKLLAILLVLILVIPALPTPAGVGGGVVAGAAPVPNWVGTWASAQYYGDTTAFDAGVRDAGTVALTLPNSTFRQIMSTSLAGEKLRLTFSNEYGTTPMVINAVSIARPNGANNTSNIDITTNTPVTFDGGSASVTIQPGQFAISDTIDFPVGALERVAVSMYFGAMPTRVSCHVAARCNSYLARDTNAILDATISSAANTNWFVLCNIDVISAPKSKSVVALGDSITDGYGVSNETYTRWVDILMNNLQGNPDTSHLSTINMGIGTNTLVTQTNPLAARLRFERDVLNQPGVGYVVFLIGTNDVPGNAQTPTNMIAAFDTMFQAAKDRGIKVFAGTIPPRNTALASDANRQTVNAWIRQQYADGNIYGLADFDMLLRNPANERALLPAYRNDDIHPNAAGYAAMGEYVYSLILEDATPPSVSLNGPASVMYDAANSPSNETATYTVSFEKLPASALWMKFKLTVDSTYFDVLSSSSSVLNGFLDFMPVVWTPIGGGMYEGLVETTRGTQPAGNYDVFSITFGLKDLSALAGANGRIPDIQTPVKIEVIEFSSGTDWLDYKYANDTVSTAITQWFSSYDVNGDSLIDGRDIAFVMNFYMMTSSDPGWFPNAARCDVNGDGKIDIIDLVFIYANFT